MRINLNFGAQELPESGRAQKNTPNGSSAATANLSSASVGEDQTLLSGAHVQVQALTAQALQLPEVRTERVQALRQAVTEGSYNPSPDDVAGAMVLQLVGEQAA